MVENVDNINFININNCNIPVEIKNVKNSKSVKIYIKCGKIIISKSKHISSKRALDFLYNSKEKVYNMYLKEKQNGIEGIINSDLDILYKGKLIKLRCKAIEDKKIKIDFLENEIIIYIYKDISEEEKIAIIKKYLIKVLKKELNTILYEKLEYYSKLMNLEYAGYSIKSMSTRFGSCNTKTKKLNFNINLIFMNEEVMDSIIVHELSHIVYANHSDKFYSLVYKYSKNYDMCHNWLKENNNYLKLLY